MRLVAIAISILLLGCASLGNTPRQKAAAVINATIGSPFYLATYASGLVLNVNAYFTAWISGEPSGNIPIWLSADYGPNYASMNTPWCWLYTGAEPEDREVAFDMLAGSHIREVVLQSLDYEWPPTFTLCRTGVGIRFNKRGDESFPLR